MDCCGRSTPSQWQGVGDDDEWGEDCSDGDVQELFAEIIDGEEGEKSVGEESEGER